MTSFLGTDSWHFIFRRDKFLHLTLCVQETAKDGMAGLQNLRRLTENKLKRNGEPKILYDLEI